ncbi:MAG: inositol-3-phosphate synthase [Vicinamibacterales bacterium]
MKTSANIAPAKGNSASCSSGLGAVATTTIAGVFAIRKKMAQPIGSLTQMGTIRLGKRTENRSPKINEFVDLASLDDIVFGGWDIFEEDTYAAARTAGVLEPGLLDKVRKEMEAIKPMPAVFDQRYVKRLSGPNVKKGKNKMDLAEQVIADIRAFKAKHKCTRLVMVWTGSTEVFMKQGPVHRSLAALEKGLSKSDVAIPSSMVYAYAALKEGIPFANAAPNLTADVPAMLELAAKTGAPLAGNDMKTGQTLVKTIIAPGLKARMIGVKGWCSTNILGNRDGEVLDDPESFKTKEESKKSALDYMLPAAALPRALQGHLARRAHQLLPAARRQQGRLGQHRSGGLARLPDAAQDQLPVPRLDPGGADRARLGAVPRPGQARRHVGHPGMAVVLLQGADARARGLPGTRPVHPAHEAEEHAAPHDGRRAHPHLGREYTTEAFGAGFDTRASSGEAEWRPWCASRRSGRGHGRRRVEHLAHLGAQDVWREGLLEELHVAPLRAEHRVLGVADMNSTFRAGRCVVRVSASMRPLIPGITTSVSSSWMPSRLLPNRSIASSPLDASSTV